MSTPIPFKSLLDINGVIGAVRWRESVAGKGAFAPPRLVESIGDISTERAKRLMSHSEALSLSIHGISQIGHEAAAKDPTIVYPVDAFTAHGMRYSIISTINRVTVLFDNGVKLDTQDLTRKMNLVDNG